jgi:predicted AlkP superfamily phosphohydrolase/phosphomutase
VCVIGLDGTPHSLLQRFLAAGVMPNLARLAGAGRLLPMTSVHPWVSSVAWTTIETGVNPAKHGIFGFIDRDAATLRTFIPLADRRRYPAVWQRLGQAGQRVVVLNTPVTFPVVPVNGCLVAGFLAPRLDERSVYPASLLPTLADLGYRIDTDPAIGRRDRDAALADIADALEKRCRTFLHLLDQEPWDFFLGVLMETDRLHHFFFEPLEAGHPVYAPAITELYRRIDAFLGQVRERLGPSDALLLLSDHGFCSIRREVNINHWLLEQGYLRFTETPPQGLAQLDGRSLAYALDPGRIFINLQGRERDGHVAPGAAYERLRDELIEAAEALVDPDSGARMVERAYRREELYDGPYLDQAADIILAPADGFDPKGGLFKGALTHKDALLVGMHTYEDAFLCLATGEGGSLPAPPGDGPVNLVDVVPTVLRLLGQPLPADGDGHPLVA